MHLIAAREIFDGETLWHGHALALEGGVLQAIVPAPEGAEVFGGTLMPGFVDLQVNGGGGVLFNEDTTARGVTRIAQAHATTGTAALLPTLITDTPDRTRAAVDAVAQAVAEGAPGVIGLHLEGPHLSMARKGAHDPALIRAMTDADEAFLLEAVQRLPNLMVTVAPESVSLERMHRLAASGVILSLGHTDCEYDTAMACFGAGVRCATHLFNAMSQLGNRAPGMVGAVLDAPQVSAGVIADGIHVHPAALRLALAAPKTDASLFLVTDAMPPVGSEITEFTLNGRRVLRRDGRLTLEDGTLAGADLDMPQALRVLGSLGLDRARALEMATRAPARLLRQDFGLGRLTPGKPCRAIRLDARGRYAGPV
ncbi:N-acetylglucosamine-6-phosphate deacetylase [Sagittula sp. M10.9X]|uniref:N-acetylglucosamine-6-phosphate deacetylase n=2 Tax=Sagittula salina TaxID=2820268 RepID=A0A940MMA2_9RHOB|nr:N-acetylglucosamine-6-phosphate deacetylase [Sagittula salina]MBP0482158.1 N-acetylglucosamine-6-phosphate deacetylase [Sagittula salina]